MSNDNLRLLFAAVAAGYTAEQRLRAIVLRTWARAVRRKLDALFPH